VGGRERKRETEVDFTEGSASDLAAELVLGADDALHRSEPYLPIYLSMKRHNNTNKYFDITQSQTTR